MRSRLDAILALTAGPDVLDVGCGGGVLGTAPPMESSGWLHGQLLQRFPSTWGIELDPEKVHVLTEAGVPNVYQGSALDFDLGRTFSTVVAAEVIEHVSDPQVLLENATRHLADDGRLIITTPYVFGLAHIAYGWAKYPKTCSNPEHVAWYCPTTLTQLAERTGLRVDSIELTTDLPPREPHNKGLYWRVRPVYELVSRLLPRRLVAGAIVATMRRP